MQATTITTGYLLVAGVAAVIRTIAVCTTIAEPDTTPVADHRLRPADSHTTAPRQGEPPMTPRPTSQDIPVRQQDVREIETLFTELISAFDAHDAVAFDSRFTEDILFTAVNGVRFTNWADLHTYHRERLTHHAEGIETWYEIEQITFPAPDIAIAAVRQPMRIATGTRENVGTWVLVRKDGRWWVCAIQNTGVASPQ